MIPRLPGLLRTVPNLLVLAVSGPLLVGCTRSGDFEGKLDVPFDGPGQLATVWSIRAGQGQETHLVVTEGGVSRRISIERPATVRWRTTDELIVRTLPSHRGGPFQVSRLSLDGHVLAVLLGNSESGFAVPAKKDRWISVNKTDEKGSSTLEILDLEAGSTVYNSRPLPPDVKTVETGPMGGGGLVWSPDSTQIAVSGFIRSATAQTFWPTIFVLSRDDLTKASVLEMGASEPGGVFPLFWTNHGIYGRSSRGLLRCRPDVTDCTLVYKLGNDRFPVTGTAVSEDTALLLVQDQRNDPLETMAKEIHQVNLDTGDARIILKLPDGALLRDIDWIGDSLPE